MSTIAAETISAGWFDLVLLRPGHAAEMAAVLADPELYAFTGGRPPTARELRIRYERWAAGSPDPAVSWCNWVICLRDPPGPAGTVQATITAGADTGQLIAEVAWIVGTRWQGQGIATEAARALVGWLEQHFVRTIVAHINPGHLASAAVAAAAGLSRTDHWQDGERRWQKTSG